MTEFELLGEAQKELVRNSPGPDRTSLSPSWVHVYFPPSSYPQSLRRLTVPLTCPSLLWQVMMGRAAGPQSRLLSGLALPWDGGGTQKLTDEFETWHFPHEMISLGLRSGPLFLIESGNS